MVKKFFPVTRRLFMFEVGLSFHSVEEIQTFEWKLMFNTSFWCCLFSVHEAVLTFDSVKEMRNWKLPKQFFPVVLFIWTVLTNFLFSAAKEIQNCEYLRMKDIKQQFLFTIMFKIVAVLELQHESFKS